MSGLRGGATYFVSPTGNDSNDGFSQAEAWLTIDNGDQEGLLQPGDTVNILSGTYLISTTVQLKTHGTAANPIVYRNYGPGRALIDDGNQSDIIIVMEGDHVVIDGLELTNTSDLGIHIKSDSCIVTNCYIHHTDKECIRVEGDYNLFLRNIAAFSTNEEGFKNEDGSEYNRYYNNTVYANAKMGLELKENTARVFNNIIALNEKGIDGDVENICAYNNVWGNTNGDYTAGVVDSAGGISVEPQLIDPANGLFYLLPTASEIDAGLDLGYYYSQAAPDMGGVEMFNVYYVSDVGNDNNDGMTEENAWLSLDNGDTKELLIPGDSVKVFPGEYSLAGQILLKTSGFTEVPITYCKWGEGSAVFDVGGLEVSVLYLNAGHVKVDGLELTNSGHRGIYLEGDSCIVTNCYLHDNDWDGIFIHGNYNLILKNLIVDNAESGIENDNTSENTNIYGNTVYSCTLYGIYIQAGITSARIFNNIVVSNNLGIDAEALNVCGFNDVWNSGTFNYFNGAFDSAGSITADPLFINPADNEFHLKTGSPAINTGLDLGYPYNETAPEMGAFEYGLPGDLNYIEVSPQDNLILVNQSSQYYAYGYDINDSLVSELTDRVNWSTDDPTGSITAMGLYTAGNNPGYYQNEAVYGLLIDTANLQVTAVLNYVQIELFDGTPFGDTTLTTDNDTTVLYCRGYTNTDSLLGGVAATWSVLGADSIGSVTDESSISIILTLTKTGIGRVLANAGTKKDTTGVITCEGGDPYRYEVEPDTATISVDSTLQFNVESYDADGNISNLSIIPSWEILGGIGTISFSGLFDATTVGEGYLVAYYAGVIPDTVGPITVVAGELARIEVTPDMAAVNLGDSINFSAIGYDADNNPPDPGDITWKLLGRVGDIDSNGLFIADRPGTGQVTAVSSINEITDSSGYIEVEELYVSTVPLGTSFVRPNQDASAVLTFRIDNYFDVDKTVTGLTLRDGSRGSGLEANRLTNIDSIAVYLDTDDDSTLTIADSLIAEDEYSTPVVSLSFDPLTIAADEGKTFIVSVNTALYACDGDSLDIFLRPAVDIVTGDATVPAGPDTVNSLGYNIIDGLVAAQLNVVSTGADTIRPADTVYPVLAVDLPRNGYSEDLLKSISFINVGTATQDDFDSLVLYLDDGDNVWGGTADETRLGRLAFTGSHWTISGLACPLSEPTHRFYVGAALSGYPRNGATVALSIPANGIDMASQNDGPLDEPLLPVDTVVIQTTEAMVIENVPIDSRELIPGESSGALLSFELTNSYADTVGIDSLRCNLLATDPDGATPEQLDSQIDSVLLYVYLNRTNDLQEFGTIDTVLATALPDNGTVVFHTDGFDISGNGGVVGFSVIALLNAQNCKDKNLIGIAIAEITDIYFDQPVTVSGEFPVQNDETFRVNAYPAANISVNSLEELTHFGGQTDRAVFDFVLPGNGYADDALDRLQLVNISSLEEDRAIQAMNLWADLTGDGFSDDDIPLGRLTSSNHFWEITGLDYHVPSGGARFIVTVDVSLEQFKAGTMLLRIPVGGVRYHSEMSGPDDIAVSSRETHLIFPSNRVTAISIPKPAGVIYPASTDNLILTFALYNSYLTQNQILQALNLTNASYSRSGLAYADYELGQVSLYYDTDANRVLGDDSLIATGYFTDGKLQLSGLDITLPPESLSYFFITVDVPMEMIDSDSLMVAIASSSDFVFSGSVNVNGDLPLTRGAYLAVDGSVHDQYYVHHLTPRTISPGDTSITLLAFQPARNGDQTDMLTGVTVANHEDADTSDITALELWFDSNGDTVWQETDSLLGTFSYTGSVWTVNSISVEISGEPPTLFVLGDIALGATPNVSFRGKIPVNGCVYQSDNDGPLDEVLLSNSTFPVSTSSLRITSSPLSQTYSVGQDIEVRFTVTNILTEAIDNVVGRMVTVSNPVIVTLSDSLVGPVTLASGESTDFYFTYTADQPGLVAWQVRALALDIPDSSVIIQTDTVMIQAAPENMQVQLINTIPTSVTKGQVNVFPMNLRFIHPDTLAAMASVRIDSLVVTVEDGDGGVLYADEAFSRMVLASGYSIVTVMETIPHQSRLTLVFSEPVVIESGTEQNFSVLVNIDSLATATQFAVAVAGAGDIFMLDNNTLLPVTIASEIVFPLRTSACRIDEPSRTMMISYVSVLNQTVNVGQEDVDVLRLRLRHPEEAGSSQIQLMSLSVQLVDSLLAPLEAAALMERISIKRQQTIIGDVYDFDVGNNEPVEVQLSMPVTLNPGEMDSIVVQVWIKDEPTVSNFGLAISDSTTFVVRDLSSGASLDVTTDTTMLASGSVFPITSGWAALKQPASTLAMCMSSSLSTSVIGGKDSLFLIDMALKYEVDNTHSSILMKNIMINVLDSLDRPLDPARLFDRIGYCSEAGTVTYQPFVELLSGSALFRIGEAGLLINPGDSVNIRLVGDIEAEAPFDHFVLKIPASNNIVIYDATDTTYNPGLALSAGCLGEFPFETEAVSIYLPAGRPALTVSSWPVQTTTPGKTGLTLCDWRLTYETLNLEGDLLLGSLKGKIYKRTSSGLEATEDRVFENCCLWLGDEMVACDSTLTGDSVILMIDGSYTLSRGSDIAFTLKANLGENAVLGNYVVRFEDSTFLAVQDKNLLTAAYVVVEGGDYPLSTVELSLQTAGLENSFSNYPNPFVPSRGEVTIIAYDLAEDATVDIEIFSITGQTVKQVVMNVFREAGAHQNDTWVGHNDTGLEVVPGTYFCRITARYVSGREESFRRKIAVIR